MCVNCTALVTSKAKPSRYVLTDPRQSDYRLNRMTSIVVQDVMLKGIRQDLADPTISVVVSAPKSRFPETETVSEVKSRRDQIAALAARYEPGELPGAAADETWAGAEPEGC